MVFFQECNINISRSENMGLVVLRMKSCVLREVGETLRENERTQSGTFCVPFLFSSQSSPYTKRNMICVTRKRNLLETSLVASTTSKDYIFSQMRTNMFLVSLFILHLGHSLPYPLFSQFLPHPLYCYPPNPLLHFCLGKYWSPMIINKTWHTKLQ